MESSEPGHELEYLCVDTFIRTFMDARALATAFEIGLIDFLVRNGAVPYASLGRELRIDAAGLRLLLNLLASNGVVREQDGSIVLTDPFVRALTYRDLMHTKIELGSLATLDLTDSFRDLICNPAHFFRESRSLRLYAYDKCFVDTEENRVQARRWMKITTSLTRYEAEVCMKFHDFSRYGRMLDIGGNSGEFALRLCRRYRPLTATVFDLPVVCAVGREHVGDSPEGGRISFMPGDALLDPLPSGFDLVIFKSMLHDWPDSLARRLIERGCVALRPGGTILIFERSSFSADYRSMPFSMLPFLLFFRSFRFPAFYEECLKGLGFQEIGIQKVALDTPFSLICARKPD